MSAEREKWLERVQKAQQQRHLAYLAWELARLASKEQKT